MNMDEAKVALDANPNLKSKSGPKLKPPDLSLTLSLSLTHARTRAQTRSRARPLTRRPRWITSCSSGSLDRSSRRPRRRRRLCQPCSRSHRHRSGGDTGRDVTGCIADRSSDCLNWMEVDPTIQKATTHRSVALVTVVEE